MLADLLPDFMQEPWFFVVMGLVLVALIGLFLFLRNKRPED
jgi:LPXTG-motif cell wall-anchored protein